MENFEQESHFINFQAVTEAKDMMAVTRLLASDLMRDGYISVGDFIKFLSDQDLNTLVQEMEDEPNERQYENLLLISEMLATGEGCDSSKTAEEFGDRMNQLVTFLVIESLYRKGLVKVFHENMSFHADMGDKIVVEKV